MGKGAWRQGCAAGGTARAEQAPGLQQNQGVSKAEVPKASHSDSSTEWWLPGLWMKDGEDRGQQVLRSQVAGAWPHFHQWLPAGP